MEKNINNQESDEVFIGSFIPRTLNQMDIDKLDDELTKINFSDDMYYDKLTGM